MKDKRTDKIARHFDIFLNGQKFKVLSYKIDEASHIFSIKTKIFGQSFPHHGRFIITIPSENTVMELCISFQSMGKTPAIEHWIYTICTPLFSKEVITMRKEMEVTGCIEIPPEMTMDEFTDEFVKLMETKGWFFGGGFKEIIDGYYINPDGTRGKHVFEDLELQP